MARLLLIDNYDSFTFNLAQGLAVAGAAVEVVRNDALTVAEVLERRAEVDGLVLSPGPGRPESAGICLALLATLSAEPALHGWPLLGVCLGHQLLGQAFGASVVRAPAPIHGKVWPIRQTPQQTSADPPDPLWAGLPPLIEATRYHSLVIAPETLPGCLQVTAAAAQAGDPELIMALRHRQRPLWGVQFHPESIGTPHGPRLLRNFVALCQKPLIPIS